MKNNKSNVDLSAVLGKDEFKVDEVAGLKEMQMKNEIENKGTLENGDASKMFKGMNRKQKRQLEAMTQAQQSDFFAYQMQSKVKETMNEHVTKAFYHGVLQAHKLLFDKYVIPYVNITETYNEENEKKAFEIISNLMIEITMFSNKFEKEFPTENMGKIVSETNKKLKKIKDSEVNK